MAEPTETKNNYEALKQIATQLRLHVVNMVAQRAKDTFSKFSLDGVAIVHAAHETLLKKTNS